jgi:hypothetical protein
MTLAGQERRAERADARSSGLTNTAEVRRPSVALSRRSSPSPHEARMSFPSWLRSKRLKGTSLPARLRLASTENPRGPHGKND